METNENLIQFRGKAAIERPLQMGRDYFVTSRVSITQVKDTPNEDGTINKTFVVEPITSEIKNEAGEKIEFKKKGKYSQALRYAVIMFMRDRHPDMDDDVTYEMFMKVLLDKFEGLATLIMKEDS